MGDVFLDTNAVINAMQLGCWAAVLTASRCRFVVAENVVSEVEYPAQARLLQITLLIGRIGQLEVTGTAELKQYAYLKTRLGDGEAATLALAASRGGIVVSDERGRFLREANRVLGPGRVRRIAEIVAPAIRSGSVSLENVANKVRMRARLFRARGQPMKAEHLERLLSAVEGLVSCPSRSDDREARSL